MTLANIISNNRKLDLNDVSVETNNNTYDLKIDFNANTTTAIITNISSISSTSSSTQNTLTIIIAVVLITIFITFGVVISFCGFQFEQC